MEADRIVRAQTTYGALPSIESRKGDLLAPSLSGALRRRHSLSARVSRRLSLLSDNAVVAVHGRQFNQLRDGVSLGLDGYNSKLNWMLLFAPLGMVGGLFHLGDVFTFVMCFFGMIPLACILGKATEDIAEHTNEVLGALVNVSMGNAIELILSLSALRAGKVALIQNTIVGSVLSNLLLVLGSAFFFGGLRYSEQVVLPAVSEANADLLSFAVFGFSIPAVFALALPPSETKQAVEGRMSLFTSVCLLAIYGMYLLFQLHTHAELYESIDNSDPMAPDSEAGMSDSGEEATQIANLPTATGILVATVVLVALLSELIVDSIDGFSKQVGLGQKFIAVILLPIVGNAVEHLSAVLVARHGKIDLAIGIACGSSVQIALFAAPLMVVISWMISSDPHLTLNFQVFDTICLAFSVFVVNATLRDSRSNWLEGALLVSCYAILAAAFYFMG